MGAIAELGVPQQGAVAALPVPGTSVTPQQADTAAFRAIASPVTRGFRAGMNSVGAMLEGLAGQTGEVLGLTDFAQDRFNSAAEYAAMSDSVAPAIRDTRQIKDLNSFVDYVAGHVGSGAATTLPAIAAGVGFRRPIAGVMGMSGALEAGEQVNTLRADPTVMATQTPGAILKNAATKGVIAGGMEALGGAGGQAARALVNGTTAGVGKNLVKGIAGEALTEAGQDLTGQTLHKDLNPQKEIDLDQTFQAAAAGAAGGGGIALATQLPAASMAVAKTGKELADRLRGPRKPRDPYGEPDNIADIKDPEDLVKALEEQEKGGWEDLDTELAKNPEKYGKYKDWKNDPDLENGFIDAVQEDYAEKTTRPQTDKAIDEANRLLEEYDRKKYTRVETQGAETTLNRMGADVLAGKTIHYKARDPKVGEFLVQNGYKEDSPGVWTPSKKFSRQKPQRTETDDNFHDFMMERIKADTKVRANPKAMLLLSDKLKELSLNPRALEESELPAGLRKIIGDRFGEIMDEGIDKFHSSDDTKQEARQILADVLQRTEGAVGGRMNAVKSLIRTNLRPEYSANKELREAALGTMAERMMNYLESRGDTKADEPFLKDVVEAFGIEKGTYVLEQMDSMIKKDTQGSYEQTGQERTIDDRLGVPMDEDKALDTFQALKEEYGDKAAHLTIVDLGKNRRGNQKYSVELEDPDTVSITEATFPSIQESKKHNKSKLSEGILTVRTKKHPAGVKVNLVNLTALMMRREGQQTQEGEEQYVADMFARGISALIAMPGFRGFTAKLSEQLETEKLSQGKGKGITSTWTFPDNTLVAKMGKTEYRFGDIKRSKITRNDLADVTKADIIKEAERIAALPAAEKATKQEIWDKATKEAIQKSWDRAMNATLGDKMDEIGKTFVVEKDYTTEGGERHVVYSDQSRMDMSRDEYESGKATKDGTRNVVEETEYLNTVQLDSGRVAPKSVSRKRELTIDDGLEYVDEQIRGEKARPEKRESDEETRLPLDGEPAAGPRGPTAGQKPAPEGKFVSDVEFEANEKRKGKDKKDYSKHKIVRDERLQNASPEVKKLQGMLEDRENFTPDSIEAMPKFSKINIGKGPITAEQRKEIRDYFERVLGKENVKVLFRKLRTHSGSFEFLDPVEQIKIAIDAIDPMSVGYHEAMHAFFRRLVASDKKAANTLLRAAGSAPIVARLKELLKDHPEALKQLSDPEERLAYMYQFWAAKQLNFGVGPETQTFFGAVKAFFRKLSAIWSDEMVENMSVEEAGEILAAFHNGDFANRSTVAQVLRDKFPESPIESARKIAPWLGRLMDKFIWTSTGAVRDMNIPALTGIMDKFHVPNGTELTDGPGFLQAKNVEFHKRLNKVIDVLKDKSEVRQKEILDELRSGEARVSNEAQDIQNILKEAFQYMKGAGVKVFAKGLDGKTMYRKDRPVYQELREIKENYFPRVPDAEYIQNNKAAFVALLNKYKIKDPESVYTKYTTDLNVGDPKEEDHVIGLTYYTPQTNERSLNNIPDAELAPFMSQDLFGTLAQYLGRATRRAEYTRRFGNAGEKIQDAREQAFTEGMTKEQALTFDEAVQAMEGSLGHTMSPQLKNLYGGLMTYQNIRLLPLALFSSLIDPLGIAVRGGTMTEAFGAFKRGLKDFVSLTEDDAYSLAKTLGTINAETDAHLMSDMYGSQYMPKTQKWINDKFFKYNGMESWNRSMRVAAVAAGEQFIIRHAEKPNEHSTRYLAELGLTKADVTVVNEKLVMSKKVEAALNMWVDQAIIRPNAALRPIYMSDPNWMLISHLKQYAYMFQKTIIARVHNEAMHGNFGPAGTIAMYVPVIIASDMLRATLTPGSGDDERMANWTMMDWLWRGIQRAGLFGPSQFVLDSGQDLSMNKIGIESMAGPTVQQLMDFARGTMTGNVSNELLKAVPGARLFQ